MITENDLILNFPRGVKINAMKDALNDGKIDVFVGLSNILLSVPLNSGGIESKIIEQIHKEYLLR